MTINPLGWLPDQVKRQLLDSLVDYLAERADAILDDQMSGILRRLKSDADFESAFGAGVNQAANRFNTEYGAIDAEVVAAIAAVDGFWTAKSIQKAIRNAIRNPGRPPRDEEVFTQHFDTVLAAQFEPDRLQRALGYFLRCLTEEVWYLPQLQPVYQLEMQRITAERTGAMLQELRGMRTDVKETMLAIAQAAPQSQPLLPSTSQPLLTLAAVTLHHNLPQPSYIQFIGRYEQRALLRQFLCATSGPVVAVIYGAGGIGKSSLALNIAFEFIDGYAALAEHERFQSVIWASAQTSILTADGVVHRNHVDGTLDEILTTIAITIERDDILRAPTGEKLALILQSFAKSRTLLIIDNLEAIEDDTVIAFLRELPIQTKCIVTSRKRIDAVRVFALPALSKEDTDALITIEARERGIMLEPSEANLLNQRTGGVPLAIIWCLAQIAYGYSPDTVISRLAQRNADINNFCFAYSVELIRGRLAFSLLYSLSLFVAGASREAICFVAGTNGDPLERDENLGVLEKLSLVFRRGARYEMLPLTKEYIKMAADLEQESRFRQIDFYLDFCSRYGGATINWQSYEHIGNERLNLLDVMEWCYQHAQWQPLVDLQYLLWGYWELRSYWTEQLLWCQRAIFACDQLQHAEELQRENLVKKATFHLAMCWVLINQGDLQTATDNATQAIDILTPLDYRAGLATAYRHLGVIAINQNHLDKAKELHAQALQYWIELNDEREISSVYTNLGAVLIEEANYTEARSVLENALAIRRRINDRSRLSTTLFQLGQIDILESMWEDARSHYFEASKIAREVGDKRNIGIALLGLARVSAHQGDLAVARSLAAEARTYFLSVAMEDSAKEADLLLAQ